MRQREEDKNKIFIFCASRLCAFRAVFGLNYFPLFFSAVLVLIVVDRMKASIDCINYHFRAPAIAARSFARDDVWIRRFGSSPTSPSAAGCWTLSEKNLN